MAQFRPRRRDQRGSVSLLVIAMLPVLLGIIGLAYDGGQVLAAKVQASDEAGEAARAGADALAPATRGGTIAVLDPVAAAAAVDNYLASTGHHGTVAINGTQVTVTVSFDQPLVVLSLFGAARAHVVESDTADAESGINQAGG